MTDRIFNEIDAETDDMVRFLAEMVSYPAINPSEGGTGEKAKAEYIAGQLKKLGFSDVKNYSCTDAGGNERPNLVVRIPGKQKQRLCIVGHMDVVPSGDIASWNTDPFKGIITDGKLYGRGTNDNGSAIAASIFAAHTFLKLGVTPEYEVCLCFVANEETGSEYGIQHLLKENIFRKDDLVIVPDMMSPKGDFIEVAEKSIFWVEFTVLGQQVHASLPQLGINATRAANGFSCALDTALHNAFPETNAIFTEPACSTFEPTRRAANVDSVNIVPGKETFAFDCRLLPDVSKADFERVLDEETARAQQKYKVKISRRYVQCEQAAPVTPEDAPAVRLLGAAVKHVLETEPEIGGVGGGTCGAFFRRAGIPAAVWGLGDNTEHMPNEYIKIEHLNKTAKVLAYMMNQSVA